MKFTTSIRLAVAGLAISWAGLTAAQSTDTENIMIVLDSSGSMWGQIEGTSKRDIARKAVGDMASGFSSDAQVGLMAYGHNRKGDCSDIEVLYDPSPEGASQLPDAVDALKPVGKTPLSDAVRQAADTLKYEENKATVILITDGIETCNLNPCEVAASLEENGVDFTAHVVGFGLTEDEGRQVSCLAEETGGTYYAAANAGELSEALGAVTETLDTSPESEDTDTTLREAPSASISVAETPVIGSNFEISWDGPNEKDDFIDIVTPDHTRTFGSLSYVYTEAESPGALRAPGTPGEYKLRYIWLGNGKREVIGTADLTVVDADVALIAPEHAPMGSQMSVAWKGPDNKGDYIDIVPEDYTKTRGESSYSYTEAGSPLEIRVPGSTGAYKLRYVAEAPDGRSVLTEIPLTVTESTAELSFTPTAPAASVMDVFWQGPDAKGDYVDIVPRGYEPTRGETSYTYTVNADESGDYLSIRIPGAPGEYDMRYVLEAVDGRQILARAPLTVTPVTAALDTNGVGPAGGTLPVAVTGPAAKGDYIDIVPTGFEEFRGELSYVYIQTPEAAVEIDLPDAPGTYTLRYVLQAVDGRYELASETITVE